MTREMILAQCREYLRLRAWEKFHMTHVDILDSFYATQRYKQHADHMLKEIVEKCNFSSEAMALQFINLEIQEGNLKND